MMKTISRILIFAVLHLCWLTSYGWAEITATDSVIAVSMQISADREKIRALLNREDVQHQLETYGISHEEALARVNSLTDAEISALVKEIGDVPAGGQLEAVVYAAILAVMLALYLPGLLFKTIECIFSDCEYKGGLSYVFRAWWKDEPISPQVKAGFCFNNCNSDYNECINTDNGENIQKSQCEIEKQLCDKQCDVAFYKDVREDTTREDTTEEDCDPGMESCP